MDQRPLFVAFLALTENTIAAQPSQQPASAEAAYAERVAALGALETKLQREHVRLGYLRLAYGVATLCFVIPLTPLVLGPVIAFGVAAREHGKVLQKLAATRRALTFHRRCIARLQGRWAELETPVPAVDAAQSLFAEDLDLFGKGSLFALLCEARTSLGRDTLAAWLLAPATVTEVLERQSAIEELREKLPLREAFAAAPGPAETVLDRAALEQWACAAGPLLPGILQWFAPLLALLTLLAAWRYAVVNSPLLLIGMLVIDAALTFRFEREAKVLFREAERASRALRTVIELLSQIEQSEFRTETLRRRRAALLKGRESASVALTRLHALGQWADARTNYVVRILGTPLLYSVQLGFAFSRWKRRFGRELATWLATVAEVEALLSLAGYNFEHPEDPFPEFAGGGSGQASFYAKALGHPLLPGAQCVRNDVALDAETRLLLVSGSNMSGKSTLLRSVGVNVVLAFAGAPVRARSLVLSPFTLAASIHVNDSLQAGRSRFYAEILRLQAITEAARNRPPALFLIDEILSGTNSSDRLAGAEGLVRELLRSGAIGLLSTHDLALTSVGRETDSGVRNVHFQDEIADGQLRFNYTLRDGPVTRSNGLALMRLIGLDV